jgi:hypothetical protein
MCEPIELRSDAEDGMSADQVLQEDTNELEVRWMASGEKACSLPTGAGMFVCVSAVKEQVCDLAGIPVAEQRLFVGGRELQPGDDASPSAKTGDSADSTALMLVRCISDPRVTDLGHFRCPPLSWPALSEGDFTAVRPLAKALYGEVGLYQWSKCTNSSFGHVVVKKLRNVSMERNRNCETDERLIHSCGTNMSPDLEDPLTEMGVLEYLQQQPDRPQYLLRCFGIFSQPTHTWIVTEYAEGGDLFALVA